MIKDEYRVIGVMSGTSLDGIDLALVNFKFNGTWHFKINKAETIAYSETWINRLKNLIHFTKKELKTTDEDYTIYLGNIIKAFINNNNIKTLDAVCSHGHTALHKPDSNITYQIGNLPKLANIINQTVVCDFRVQDVAYGGQGAPLVPIGDKLLFSNFDYCVNLGGFANVSFSENGKRIAFDICPVNIVLNTYVSRLGYKYDDKGVIASKGDINNNLLNQLNRLQFYKKEHPKSLGLEWVNTQVFPLINNLNIEVNDILRTFVEHIAIQISTVINHKQNASVLITGGGVFNIFLIERIKVLSINAISMPSNQIIEFKEALIFGFLGVLKLRNENNCLAKVTGAKQDHSSGEIFHF